MRHARKRKKVGASVLATAVAAAVITGLAVSGSAAGEAGTLGESAEQAGGAGHLVTLITGDQVRLAPDGDVRGLVRAEGRESVPVQVTREGDATLVVPADAEPLIQEGTLDKRLFDVTELTRDQYRERDGLPVIVTYEEGASNTLLDGAGVDPGERLPLKALDGDAFTLAPDEAPALWQTLTAPDTDGPGLLTAAPGVSGISLDAVHQAALAESTGQIGAPAAWDAGYDGDGVTIAVLDTGIEADHPDLSGQVTAAENFSQAPDTVDRVGHGTHVAAIAAGTGAATDGTHRGVAPGAELLSGKVLDDQGYGLESEIIAGMEWAVEQGADIVNMSIGGPPGGEGDPLEEAVNGLSESSGTLFVASAGNLGPEPGGLESPGTAEAALTVGAVDQDDALTEFSSVGPQEGISGIKPDVTAPGESITAAAAEGIGGDDDLVPGLTEHSGTSMAAPHAAGAAALLAQQHPEWTGAQLKAALTGSAEPGDASAHQQGAGRINAERAMELDVIAESGAVDFGTVEYPHDTGVLTGEVTYRNLGDSDVTLELESEGLGPDGAPAPEGMFATGASEVTVEAGSTAVVEVTADPAVAEGAHGDYSLYLTATTGGSATTTAGAVTLQEELFELSVRLTDRDGEPDPDAMVTATAPLAPVQGSFTPDEDGVFTAQFPAGSYQLDAMLQEVIPEEDEFVSADWLVHPQLDLTEDTTVDLSAQDAEEVDFRIDDESAAQTGTTVELDTRNEDGGDFTSTIAYGAMAEGLRTLRVGEPARDWENSATITASWEAGGVDSGEPLRETHTFHTDPDGMPTGVNQHIDDGQLARVTADLGATMPDRQGLLFAIPDILPLGSAQPRPIPAVAEVYVQADGAQWSFAMDQLGPDEFGETGYRTGFEEYQAGEEYGLAFNHPVFGPVMNDDSGIARQGDTLVTYLSLFGDGSGHQGATLLDAAETSLHRDGEELFRDEAVLEELEFDLPSDEGEYRLASTLGRASTGVSALSPQVSVAYTFTSASTEDGEAELFGSSVLFAPELDADGSAPAGESLTVPFTVQGVAAVDGPALLTVEVSFDSGERWSEVEARLESESGTDGEVTIDHPEGEGTVSLRATVEDSGDGVSEQTVIDAYLTR